MIDIERKKKIIRGYLGRFASSVSKEERTRLLSFIDESLFYYLKGSSKEINKFISVYLMKGNRINWSYRTTYDTVQLFLGQNEESVDFMDLSTPLLIVENCKNTVENRQLEPLNKQLIFQRISNNLPTIFIASSPLSSLESMGKVLSLGKLESTIEDDTII